MCILHRMPESQDLSTRSAVSKRHFPAARGAATAPFRVAMRGSAFSIVR
jgi:hypothetical protein